MRSQRTFSVVTAKTAKTIDIRDSLVVTHPTTSRTASFLSTAERTGSAILRTLWPIAKDVTC